MRRLLLAALLVLAGAGAARATTIVGGDWGGANLAPANGDTLSGTFTNVGHFIVGAGTTAFAAPGVNLTIYATTVTIAGTLDGTGRGLPSGSGGSVSGPGAPGTGQAANAGGNGGAAGKGGSGGAAFGIGGEGAGAGGGSSSTAYGLSISTPLSSDDALQGSGGGGGGGGSSASNGTGGDGSFGGGAIYIEASSITVLGAGVITVAGATTTAVADGAGAGTHPGGGGGGGGGTLILRGSGALTLKAGARFTANGGKGGDVAIPLIGGTLEPGGGGGGGRVYIAAATPTYEAVFISTGGGPTGTRPSGFSGTVDSANNAGIGNSGLATFGVVAAQPTGLTAQGVYVTSISYVWNALTVPQFGDGPTIAKYHLYPSTDVAPFGNPDATTSVAASTLTSLSPNTTYFEFVTGYTDWGDSAPSSPVSTHTLANVPGAAAAAFTAMADVTATFNWTANAPANPAYTSYEVDRSTSSGFAAPVSTGFVVGLSSAPAGLLPNTTYYWRVRAVNLDGISTAFAATAATATLATAPSAPAFGTVFVTSASFAWSAGGNPPDTVYQAQVSTDNFFSLAAASSTLASSATFFSLTPGTQYFFRAFALNRNAVASAFSAVMSTRSGNLADLTSPTSPGTPQADRQFSYDGTAVYAWAPSQSSVGILDYHLIIGSTPGGNDVVDLTTTSLVYQATGLTTGRSYYARVSGRSNAGVTSPFSAISRGLPVFIPAQVNPLDRAINWPNPFDPSQGPTQIGFTLDQGADVELKIFTLQGRLVHGQSFSFGAAGNQIVTWDGRNDAGGKVAPGGYVGLILKHYPGHTSSQKLKIAVLY